MKRLVFIFVMLSICGSSSVGAAGKVGIMCQQDYEDGWQTTLSYIWSHCNSLYFAAIVDLRADVSFYYNLHGARFCWEESRDQWYLDNVDLFYAVTHGASWSDTSAWSMWDRGSWAVSKNMVLGDENRKLSIFSTYSCETLAVARFVNNYRSIMGGGLRYTTGSHDKLYSGFTTDECGEDYVDNLASGDPIKYAWRDALSDWWVANDAAAMSTGGSLQSCLRRRDVMRYSTYSTFPRVTGNNVSWYCMTYWNNL